MFPFKSWNETGMMYSNFVSIERVLETHFEKELYPLPLQGVQQWQREPGWPPLPPGQSDQPPVRGHSWANPWHQPPVDIPGRGGLVLSPGNIWCRLTTSPRAGVRCSMRTLSGAESWSPPGISLQALDTWRTLWSATSLCTGPGPGTRCPADMVWMSAFKFLWLN